ncbi:long-chain fatty acid--CoA ligase [Nonomuraea sp. KC401]|uniref:acyl-CoA synthetase n=1 Tax=unclassified Nonomuraea TaxID=2593643 RepID=UPI0010FCDE0C|nr:MULTISPECIES: long-chain fatty acid--CoA ligase [unclassified Nonomuraea]NBE97825.1 AMP-binding protein [Nonomuraea sp. K271]TLF63058.1 long-chain fatty acid--CoA ligase [Nonomuraea sp. KC401]
MRNQGTGSWPARRARMTPERVALSYLGHDRTYRDLRDRTYRLASALSGLDVRRGDRVAFLGANQPSMVETFFAAGLLGAVFVPLNTRLATPELRYILEDADAKLLVLGEGRDGAGLPGEHIPPDAYDDLLESGSPEPVDEPVGQDDVCLIMYTSGTTGRPKGAMLTHGNLTWNTVNLLVDVPFAHDEVTLVSAPLFHIAALAQTLIPTVLKGGRVVLEPSFDVERTFDLIASERVTVMFGVPSMFGFLARSPRWAGADLSSLRHLLCGGAPVPEPLIRTYQERGLTFLQGYGMTETAPGALFLGAEHSIAKAGTAGVPCFFSDVRLVAPDGSAAGPGEPGEVYVQGPNVMPGYWGRPEESAKVLSPDGWFRSGDVGVADEDGYVRISDRLNDVIISGGENVYPAEVESVLYGHEAVAECAVIGVPDDRWGEVGKALVVTRPGAKADPAELLAYLDGRLARFKIPKSLELVPELPKNAAGKLLKAPLRTLYGGSDDGLHPRR